MRGPASPRSPPHPRIPRPFRPFRWRGLHKQVDNFCNSMPDSLTRVMEITGKVLEYHEV